MYTHVCRHVRCCTCMYVGSPCDAKGWCMTLYSGRPTSEWKPKGSPVLGHPWDTVEGDSTSGQPRLLPSEVLGRHHGPGTGSPPTAAACPVLGLLAQTPAPGSPARRAFLGALPPAASLLLDPHSRPLLHATRMSPACPHSCSRREARPTSPHPASQTHEPGLSEEPSRKGTAWGGF